MLHFHVCVDLSLKFLDLVVVKNDITILVALVFKLLQYHFLFN